MHGHWLPESGGGGFQGHRKPGPLDSPHQTSVLG